MDYSNGLLPCASPRHRRSRFDQGNFFRLLLIYRWPFMYFLILQFFKIIQWKLMPLDDLGILTTIKYYTQHGTKRDLESRMQVKIDWKQAILDAKSKTDREWGQ